MERTRDETASENGSGEVVTRTRDKTASENGSGDVARKQTLLDSLLNQG
jgi:hypothetical protein